MNMKDAVFTSEAMFLKEWGNSNRHSPEYIICHCDTF